ncbi:MAG: hypothetical protein H0V17_29550 [Deltaproteobacteria bacterium]|nr:hypothetical protein [Deltaproteobacteria bacterium]
MFKWVCLGVAIVGAAIVIWMLNDMRTEVKRTNEMVGERLPRILENVEKGTATLAQVSKDIDSIRDLAGLGGSRERSLVGYADSVLDFLEKLPGQIGLEKVLGAGIKDALPAAEWAAGARKEGLFLSFRAASKHELLDRLGKNKFGSPWMYVAPSGEPISMIDLLKRDHPESKAP